MLDAEKARTYMDTLLALGQLDVDNCVRALLTVQAETLEELLTGSTEIQPTGTDGAIDMIDAGPVADMLLDTRAELAKLGSV
jgi:hypothetical protein